MSLKKSCSTEYMEQQKAIELLQKQIEDSKPLDKLQRYGPEWKKWRRDTEVAIEAIFGSEGRHLHDFSKIQFSLGYAYSGMPAWKSEKAYSDGFETARQILASMISEIEEFGISTTREGGHSELPLISLFNRFHLIARQLQDRRLQRSTIEIEDEYDVQDLLHGLLHLISDDIRPEEWTPSYAGGSSRVDFLLKKEKTIIEVKKTRQGLTMREIGDQLIVDISRYQIHPDCERLICFIYDPEGRIGNPIGIERDLTKTHSDLPVTVIVGPKGR